MANRKYKRLSKNRTYKRRTFQEFKLNAQIRGLLVNRLKKEGKWDAYKRVRQVLKAHGVDPRIAGVAAVFQFPRDDGGELEIVDHPAYAEIQRDWENKTFPLPPEFEKRHDGTTNFSKFKEPVSAELTEAIKEVKAAPAKLEAAWDKLAKEVGKRPSTSHEADLRWIVENYKVKPGDIDPADVPSRAALSQMRHATDSVAHFGDIQKQYDAMQKNNAKSQQGRARFKDDGRSLELIEMFEETLRLEAEPDSPKGSTS